MSYSDNYLVSNSLYCESIFETEEARKVACEQYNRANRLERVLKVIRVSRTHWRELYERVSVENVKEIKRGNLWMEIARKSSKTAVKMGSERDELQAQNAKLVEKTRLLSMQRDAAVRWRNQGWEQSDKLVTALKEIGEYDKVVPDSVPLGVLLIIDRALINYREK